LSKVFLGAEFALVKDMLICGNGRPENWLGAMNWMSPRHSTDSSERFWMQEWAHLHNPLAASRHRFKNQSVLS